MLLERFLFLKISFIKKNLEHSHKNESVKKKKRIKNKICE